MKILRNLLYVLTLLVAIGVSHSDACGGPGFTSFPAVVPPHRLVDSLLDPFYWDALAYGYSRKELRLLYPALKSRPQAVQPLWLSAYAGELSVDEAKTSEAVTDPVMHQYATLLTALRLDDLDRIETTARAVVGGYMALPPTMGSGLDNELWHAVEVAELLPMLRALPSTKRRSWLDELGTSAGRGFRGFSVCSILAVPWRPSIAPYKPNAADRAALGAQAKWCSLRLPSHGIFTLLAQSARKLPANYAPSPNAYAGEIHPLLELSQNWLTQNPNHVLADWVKFWQVRLYHFLGETTPIWQIIADTYVKYPARSLAEARYHVLTHPWPDVEAIEKMSSPELVVGLLSQDVLRANPGKHANWWKWAENNLDKPWAFNLEERLLAVLASDPSASLPAWFPEKRATGSALWGKLRTVILAIHGRFADATEQAALLEVDAEQAVLLAASRMRQLHAYDAIITPKLDAASRAYIAQVWATEDELLRLCKAKNKELVRVARIELAARAMAKREFDGAVEWLSRVDAKQALVFKKASAFKKAGDTLALARLLFAEFKGIGLLKKCADERGMNSLHDVGSAERAKLEDAIRRSDARYLALELYAEWLESNWKNPSARNVLREADLHYNQLVNDCYGGLWLAYAEKTPMAERLRAVGRKVRKTQE